MSERRAVADQRRLDFLRNEQGTRDYPGDPYLNGALGRARLDTDNPRLEVGVILDALPGGYAYMVSAASQSTLWCSPAGTSGSFQVLGGKSLHTYVLGQTVVFMRHPKDPMLGYILGALPHRYATTANQPAESSWPFIRSGQLVEGAHQFLVNLSQQMAMQGTTALLGVDALDVSAGRLLDATTAGEWGINFETGVALFADPFHASLSVDAETGFFCFYADQLTRLTGHDLQIRSAKMEYEDLDDQGELRGYVQECVYPWEYQGLWLWNQITPGWLSQYVAGYGLQGGQGVAYNSPYEVMDGSGEAPCEPEYYAQIPAARKYEWTGYVGQGGMREVALPTQVVSTAAVTAGEYLDPLTGHLNPRLIVSGENGVTAGVDEQKKPVTTVKGDVPTLAPNVRGGPDQPGVFEEHTTLTGDLHVRARRVVFSKRSSIPVPRPVIRPEDPVGDNPSNYSPSGLINGVVTHHVVGEFPDVTAARSSQYRAALLPDAIAYLFNWENLHPFAYHTNDWFVAQEGAAGSTLVNQQVPVYSGLTLDQYLNTPIPYYLDVDHRYGPTPYYQNESGWCLWEDGSIVLYDGWGSEIRMGGGGVEIRCAGDVLVSSGRDVVTFGGRSVVIKGRDTVDVASTGGDIFMRADQKFHAVSGNSGCGGFLFENKATCPSFNFSGVIGSDTVSSGFVFLSPQAPFIVLAQDIVLSLDDTSDDGRLVLDAGDTHNIYTTSGNFISYVPGLGSIIQLFDDWANEFNNNYALIGTSLSVDGSGYFDGCVSTSQWFYAGGHIQTNLAATYGNIVSNGNLNTGIYDVQIATREEYLIDTYQVASVAQVLYPPEVDNAEFTQRDSTQYGTLTWVYWESRWTTLADLDGQSLWIWTESPVVGTKSGVVTYAFPGEISYTIGSYQFVIPTFADPNGGWIAIDRANFGLYESATVNPPTLALFSGSLKVTTPPLY